MSQTSKTWFRPALIALCLLAGIAHAAEPVSAAPRPAGPVTLILGHAGTGAATLIVASESQQFSRAGMAVRLDPAPDDDAAEQAVADGRAEFGAAQLSASFFAYAAAHDLRIIAPEYADRTGFPSTVLVVSRQARDAGLRGPANLAHRRIGALALETTARFALVQAAARYGVPASAIQLVQVRDKAELQSDLASGVLDGALALYADALAWHEKSRELSIIRLSDFVQWQDGVIFVRAATLRGNAGEAAAFMRAYRAAVADYDLTFQQRDDEGTALPGAHFGLYLRAIAAWAGLEPNAAAYALPFCDPRARLDTEDLGRQLAFWQTLGLVGQQVAVGAIADASLNPEHFDKM